QGSDLLQQRREQSRDAFRRGLAYAGDLRQGGRAGHQRPQDRQERAGGRGAQGRGQGEDRRRFGQSPRQEIHHRGVGLGVGLLLVHRPRQRRLPQRRPRRRRRRRLVPLDL